METVREGGTATQMPSRAQTAPVRQSESCAHLPSAVGQLKNDFSVMLVYRIRQLFKSGNHLIRVNAGLPPVRTAQGVNPHVSRNDHTDLAFSRYILIKGTEAYSINLSKKHGLSVRCLKD